MAITLNNNRILINEINADIEQGLKDLEQVNQDLFDIRHKIRLFEQDYNLFRDWTIEFSKKIEFIEMEATGYAPFDNQSGMCNDGNPNLTATMTKPDWGTIAVNPKVIPYGTKIYVEGYGWGVAEDTGALIRAREDLIDLYFDTYKQAKEWGRRKVKVAIIR